MSQWQPIAQLAADVQAGKVTAASLVERSLKTIADKSDYQAIIATLDDAARTRAKHIDERVAKGETVGRLAGVPFIAKDNMLVFGADATAGSNILKGFRPPYQSTVINRLEAEGAICVAKANQDAFGHGASTENSDFFTTKNPHDTERVPGGSSGGSAAAVMLEMVPFSVGTDTGGSIRQPASYTGAVGLRPTYGVTSRSGVVAMASSTDTIGPLARTVEDAAYVFDIYAGPDDLDATTIPRDPAGYTDAPKDIKGKKVGLIKEWMTDDVDQSVRDVIRDAVDKLRAAGAEVIDVSIPSLPLSLAVYYIVIPAEVSSNLSRYDGQRFGYSYPDAKNLEESFSKSRSLGFGAEAKRRIMIGTYVLSSGYYDAYYKKAQTVRTKLIGEFNDVFKQVDFLIGPVAPTPAFKIGENAHDPMQMYLVDVMTVAAALVGIPAISVPGNVGSGLPIGVQLMAPQRADRALLGIATATEELLA